MIKGILLKGSKRSVALLVMLMASVMMVWAQEMNEKFSMTTQMFLNGLKEQAVQQTQGPRHAPGQQRNGNLRQLKPRRLIASPDTVRGTAYISCFIHLRDTRDLTAIRSLGVEIEETFEGLDFVTARVPVHQLERLADIDNVTRIKVAQLMRPMTNTARQKTNVDDLLKLSADATNLGITTKYDGSGVVLGIIDTGIDFQHFAFKDKNGTSRIKKAYVYNGSSANEYSTVSSSSPTTDDKTEDHGTHTATTAGGSSVKVSGSTVTVTDDHANATYGGMAPGADLYLAGVKGLEDTYLTNALKKMVTYADNQGQPLVVSNSWGSGWGPRDGTGDYATLVSQYFGDNHPNHIILFASSNDAGKGTGSEGGGYFVKKSSASSASPLGAIIRTEGRGGDCYAGLMACAWSSKKLYCKIYVLDNSTGAIKGNWTVKTTSSVSGLSDYYEGSMAVAIDQENGKYRLAVYTGDYGINSIGSYTLAIEVYPASGSADVSMWGGDWSYFTNHLSTSGHTWTAGTDDMCVSDEATIPNAISVGAYVSKKTIKNSQGQTIYYSSGSLGDIACFSSYATSDLSPTDEAYPWITAPGSMVVAGVNHYHKASVDEYSYYGSDYISDLVVNNSNNPYAAMEGTSMATPVAAGIVALWLQAAQSVNKDLTVNDVKNIMEQTAIRDSYVTTGSNASHFGKGKIDALAGIKYILDNYGGSSGGDNGESTGEEITGTETIDFSDQGFANETAVTIVNSTNCTITFDKGTSSNAPKYYTTGTAIRMYAGNTMTITPATQTASSRAKAAASNAKGITGVTITFGSGDGSNEITTNVESYNSGTWTGNAPSVTFTVGGTSGNRRIKSVAVTYSASAPGAGDQEDPSGPDATTLAYYKKANGKKGSALKTSLCGIINNRTEKSYDYLWTAFKTTDVRSDGKIWDMYSNITNYQPGGSAQGANYSQEGDSYNREHSFPQSWFGSNTPMYTDLHHIYPTDGFVNGKRDNYPFGETNGNKYKSANNFSKLGNCTYPGYTGIVFEPNDEYKGDFARTYFYMVTCYEEKLSDWYNNNTASRPVLDGNTYPGLSVWQLNMLMEWAKNDPVSQKEINRNNAVYTIQKNRNPFIDYPGLEEYIWGTMQNTAFSYDHYVQPDYNKEDVTMSFSPATATATIGENFTEPTLTTTPSGLTVTYSSSNTSVATVNSSTGKVTLVAAGTTTITATFAGNNTYNGGSASYTLTVNAASTPIPVTGSGNYELVEDASTLNTGDKILITYINGDTKHVLSTTQNANNRAATDDVTVNTDGTLKPGEKAQIITLEKDGSNYLFNVGNGYLYAASSNANHLKTETTADANARASISIKSGGDATIVFQGENKNNIVRYNPNNGNPIFSCYASSTSIKNEPQIYRLTILLGDANGDGIVNIADVTAIINYINHAPSDNFNEQAADANKDGVINIADVTAIINIINN